MRDAKERQMSSMQYEYAVRVMLVVLALEHRDSLHLDACAIIKDGERLVLLQKATLSCI